MKKDKKFGVSMKYCSYMAVILVGFVIGTDMSFANSKFDIDAGVAAATAPVITAFKAHWGKGVLLSGAGAALFSEGDARQRAVRAGMGCAAAGGVILGLISLLS